MCKGVPLGPVLGPLFISSVFINYICKYKLHTYRHRHHPNACYGQFCVHSCNGLNSPYKADCLPGRAALTGTINELLSVVRIVRALLRADKRWLIRQGVRQYWPAFYVNESLIKIISLRRASFVMWVIEGTPSS